LAGFPNENGMEKTTGMKIDRWKSPTISHDIADENIITPLFYDGMSRLEDSLGSLDWREPAYKSRPDDWMGASSVGGCARAIAYSLVNAPREPMDKGGRWLTSLGTLVHLVIQHEAPHVGYEVEKPFKIEKYKLASEADLVGHGEVVDIKTIAQPKIEMIRKFGPRYKDVAQVGVAMEALGVDRGRVAYMSREVNEAPAHEIEITFTRDQIDPIINLTLLTIKRVREMLADGELPPRWIPNQMPPGSKIVTVASHSEGYGHWLHVDTDTGESTQGRTRFCGFCPYREHCKEGETE